MPNHYTAEQKAEALRLYVDLGPAEAARQTGVPAGVVSKWGQRAGLVSETAELTARATETAKANREARKAALAEALLGDAEKLRARLWQPAKLTNWGSQSERVGSVTTTSTIYQEQEIAEPPYKDKLEILRSVATAIDKSQLLAGEATSRDEHVSAQQLERILNDAIPDPDARRRLALQVLEGGREGMGGEAGQQEAATS